VRTFYYLFCQMTLSHFLVVFGQVEKPDNAKHEASLKEITNKFESMREERRKTQEKIEAKMNNKGSPLGKEREVFNSLGQKKGKLIEEKRAIRSQLYALKATADKLAKDRKDTRSVVKFHSVKDIDAEISCLQRRQETTSLSLSEEKKLIKEMDALKASKEKIKDLKDLGWFVFDGTVGSRTSHRRGAKLKTQSHC